MKVLFIGGTGILSSECGKLTLARGHELTLLVRGRSSAVRPYPAGARVVETDTRDVDGVRRLLAGNRYDVVVDFVAFTPEHADIDERIFGDKTNQFVFVSSASAYHKPVTRLPIRESTLLHNPFWQYSRDKIASEEALLRAYRERGFPVTIVRPSHTYDRTLLPFDPHGAGVTVLKRILEGKPIVVHGDGTSLWVLTHSRDFAVGLVGLFGHRGAIGEAFHITSDEALPWNEIYGAVARAAGREPRLVHVASEVIARFHPAWGASLLGDKAHSVLFDNSKVRSFVPEFRPLTSFHEGAREIVAYHLGHGELAADPALDALMDRLAAGATAWAP